MPQDVRDMGPVPRPDLGKARVRVVPVALGREPGPPREHMRDGSVLLERELEHNPQPEDRHAVEENGAARRDQVERFSPPHGRERSDDHPDEGREDRRRRVHGPPDHDPQDFPHLDSSHAVVPEGPPPDQRGGGGGGGLLGGGARSLSSSFAARRLRTIATATAMTMMATMPNGMP